MHFLPPQKSRQILPRIEPASVWSGSHYEPFSIRQPFGFSVTLSKIQHLRQICRRCNRSAVPLVSSAPFFLSTSCCYRLPLFCACLAHRQRVRSDCSMLSRSPDSEARAVERLPLSFVATSPKHRPASSADFPAVVDSCSYAA